MRVNKTRLPRNNQAMMAHHSILNAEETTLLIIDVQERFRSVIPSFDSLLTRCVRLARTFRALELPILVTEQYPKGLGHTVPELLDILQIRGTPEKSAFSSFSCEEISDWLPAAGVRSTVVCGIETHVCVNQTVHDLLAAGYAAHVACDAVTSRESLDHDVALRRMEKAGAIPTTSETVAFELLRDAKHEKFKEVQSFFK